MKTLPITFELDDDGARDFTLLLRAGPGEVLLRARRRQQSAFSDAFFAIENPLRAAQFWRAIAEGLDAAIPACHEAVVPAQQLLSLRSLPPLNRPEVWESLELCIGRASLVIHLAVDTGLGELEEKAGCSRELLFDSLRGALGDVEGLPAILPPRPSAPRRSPLPILRERR